MADKKYWPRQRGFDYQYGAMIGELDYFTHEEHHVLDWIPSKTATGPRRESLIHVTEDKLIIGCWSPGEGRSKPPIIHAEFATKVRDWIEKGAAIPE